MQEPTTGDDVTEAADEAEDVLAFWFGRLDPAGRADDAHQRRWFTKDPAFDELVRARFGTLHAQIAAGEREAWLGSPRGTLAYVIVADQFSRNMFRGSPGMFATDERALRAAESAIARGDDRALAVAERIFLYMPFMHAEDVEAQRQCCASFAALRDEVSSPFREEIENNLKFAEAHRAIVERFGRFPHRNDILGRATTAEEAAFLKQPGSSF